MPAEPLSLADALLALRRTHVEAVLLQVAFQLVIIIVTARVFAYGFRRIGQSGVVGEIIAGLILGPSLLSRLDWVNALFHPTLEGVPAALSDEVFRWIFTILAQLGLVFLLFLIGLEFDFSHLKVSGRSALAISLTGILLPFGLGLAITPILLGSPGLGTPAGAARPLDWSNFGLFLGVAMSITALPILGRMMIELNIHRTKLGAVTITSAAVDDAAGWILLACVAAIVQTGFNVGATLFMLGLTVGFAGLMIFVVRPLLVPALARLRTPNGLGVTGLAVVLICLLFSSIATNLIGIYAIFGAFLFGAVLSENVELKSAVSSQLRDFVTAFFLPIFFTYTGLRTRIQSLDSVELWLLCGLVILAAVVGKYGGCALAARLTGFSSREASCVGVMMNTRALMELIVINVGYELRVIPESVFCMLVLMAVVTTLMTTPILLWQSRGTSLEPLIRDSVFQASKNSPLAD